MNTRDALLRLAEILQSFTVHKQLLKELSALLKKELKGKEAIFFNALVSQLANLDRFKALIYQVDGHEILKGFDGRYYSIHLQHRQFNVRLIVYVDDSDNIYLLCAFYERSGKGNTDYSKHTEVIEQRLRDLKEE